MTHDLKRHLSTPSDDVEEIVRLAALRVEHYYHSSTNTHIITQFPRLQFSAFLLKGYGDFADEALESFEEQVRKVVIEMTPERKRQLINSMNDVHPDFIARSEFQISLSDNADYELKSAAAIQSIGVRELLGIIVERELEKLLNGSKTSEFLELLVKSGSSDHAHRAKINTYPISVTPAQSAHILDLVKMDERLDDSNDLVEAMVIANFAAAKQAAPLAAH